MEAETEILEDRNSLTYNKENKMGDLPVKKLLISMSLPPMFSMIVVALYNIVDSIFLAKVGITALTAVTIAFPVQMFMMSCFVGTGVGISSLISRRLGEKKQELANNAAVHALIIAVMWYILFLIFGLFFVKPFVMLFTNEPKIISEAVIYLRIVCVGSIFVSLSVQIERIMQGTGNMILPMVFNAIASGSNAILAPMFILGIGFFPRLEITGAGFVAVFGQFLGAFLAVLFLLTKEQKVHLDIKGFKFHLKTIKDIFVVGAPTIILMSMTSFMISTLNIILGSLRAAAIPVLGVYFRVQSFIFMPIFGMCQGALPIMGYNYGAKNKKRLMETYKIALISGIIVLFIGMGIFLLFPHQIMSLFNAEGDVMKLGVVALRTIALGFPFASFTIVSISFYQALGHGIIAMFVSLLRLLILIIPMAYFLSRTFSVEAGYFSFPIAECITFIVGILLATSLYKREVKYL